MRLCKVTCALFSALAHSGSSSEAFFVFLLQVAYVIAGCISVPGELLYPVRGAGDVTTPTLPSPVSMLSSS